MTSLEAFEKWHNKKYCLLIAYGEPTAAQEVMRLKPIYWNAWLASRAELMIELPEWNDTRDADYACGIDDCREAIEAAGVKVKP